jgi:redox-sensitive bicupin YhaK (pirin superfamily)
MMTLRPAEERGAADFGWLQTRHSFSFADYYDPAHMGFQSLRVINDDRVAPAGGFDTHGHKDMEIVTYVLDGALEHRDSLGNGSVIRAGDVQRMSAGTGIRHSEYNPSAREPVHLLQIWIYPERKGLAPGYEQKTFPEAAKRNRLRLIASRDGRLGSVTVHQDADLYASVLEAGRRVAFAPAAGRHVWIQVARGTLTVNGQQLKEGDGLAIAGEGALDIVSETGGEFLLFDLA